MLSFLLALALGVSAAKEIAVPGLALAVEIPDPPAGEPQLWGHTLGDETLDVRLSMYNAAAYTQVIVGATWWQTPLDQLPEGLASQVLPESDENFTVTPGEVTLTQHPSLGPTARVKAEGFDTFMEAPRWVEVAVFSIAGATVEVSALSSESAERATLALDEVLGMMRVKEPALPLDQLRMGTVEADAGYRLTLPPGLRALTLEEERKLDSTRISGEGPFSGRLARTTIVDTRHLARTVFSCVANSGANPEVLHPEKSPVAVQNFKAMASVLLKGGRFRFVNGTQESMFEMLPSAPVHPDGDGEVQFLQLRDRDAYLWTVPGTVFQDPVHAALFYTAYDDVGLHCGLAAPKDRPEWVGTFESIVKGLEVIDSAQHPMPMSLKARYIRWWRWSPYTDPLLQLYWLPIPLFLIAGWLVLKDD